MLLVDFSFGLIYGDTEGPCHGGSAGNEIRVEFSDDEYITEISGWKQEQVNQVIHSYIPILNFNFMFFFFILKKYFIVLRLTLSMDFFCQSKTIQKLEYFFQSN